MLAAGLLTAALCTVGPLAAQSFTLVDQNARFRWSPAPAVGAFSDVGFSASPCQGTADNLYAWHWCFAVLGDPTATVVSDAGHGAYAQTLGNRSATQWITDLRSRGLLNARVDDVLTRTGPDAAYVAHSLQLTNVSAAPLTLRVYLFVDVDYGGIAANYSLRGSAPDRLLLGSNAACGGCFEVFADQPAHFMVNRVGIANSVWNAIRSASELTDTGLPAGSPNQPIDIECGFQWQFSLAANETATVRSVSGHNDLWVGSAASVTHAGTAVGGSGPPPALTVSPPVLGQDITFNLTGGASQSALLFGAGAPNPPWTQCGGLAIGFSVFLASIPMPTTGGAGTLVFDASRCSLDAVGIPFAWQAICLDQTSSACLPVTHSDVVTIVFGD